MADLDRVSRVAFIAQPRVAVALCSDRFDTSFVGVGVALETAVSRRARAGARMHANGRRVSFAVRLSSSGTSTSAFAEVSNVVGAPVFLRSTRATSPGLS